MTYPIRLLLALLALACFSAPAHAEQLDTPPAPLWRMEANGDAVQTDLGFILPARWRDFERTHFTSSRPDGASVMAHYRRADGVRMGILIQLRVDVRGVAMPGTDAIERNWSLIRVVGDTEFPDVEGQPEVLADERILWGQAAQPNARMRLRAYRRGGQNEVQGLWYRNIGLWAVVVRISGPAERRPEIEAAGRAAMTGIQWPGAPLTAELRALAPRFPRDLPECGTIDRAGTGEPIDPGPAISAMIGTALSVYFLDTARTLPHPALDPRPYCRIETFRVGSYEVIALGWRGDHAGFPAARYAFMLAGHGVFFQFEGLFHLNGVAEAERRGIRRPVWLTLSGPRKVELLTVLTDWPSYERAKEIIIAIGTNHRTPPLVELTAPPGQVHATVNYNAESARPAPTPQ
ncbi:MAG TPA: hypothetical protein VGW40_16050 [Allosphingosinicella sp.]|nr:hypothetical protein [Allosphingosinicella sp.]